MDRSFPRTRRYTFPVPCHVVNPAPTGRAAVRSSAAAGGGFVQLTGEVGTGKTTVCRCLLQQLPPHMDAALVLNPRLTCLELLATVCDELRIPNPSLTNSVKVMVDALYRYLLDAHAHGRRTVLVIDEAQNLSVEVLEQIRVLTNLETDRDNDLASEARAVAGGGARAGPIRRRPGRACPLSPGRARVLGGTRRSHRVHQRPEIRGGAAHRRPHGGGGHDGGSRRAEPGGSAAGGPALTRMAAARHAAGHELHA
jgi:hypothetical protein